MGGGDLRKNPTEAKTAHLMQNEAIFCYFKHKIQLFKVLLSLKVVKFDTKIYLNFSNFRGRTSAGGTSLGPKTGTSVGWGGDWQNFRRWGGPPVPPPRKKTLRPTEVTRAFPCLTMEPVEEGRSNMTVSFDPILVSIVKL